MNKQLIINADDFGICTETNKAIAELYQAKKITSTSLLVSAEASSEAIQIIKDKKLDFGVHLTLNSDFQSYPWDAVSPRKSNLADNNGKLFADTAYIAKHALSKEVTAECEAQINKCKSLGISPDHLDNHCATMYGMNGRLFFINAFRLSKRYHLPFRFPKRNSFLNGYFGGQTPFYIRTAHKGVALCAKILGATIIDDMITNPYSIKDIPDYKTLENYYLRAISTIKDGVTELFLHPSYDAPKYSAATAEWKKRQYELAFLFSSSLEKRLQDEGITLISYKML
ncbi:MAG: ChbG/HpnK family deacetylase [Clostridia bacterium]|nr:ChbG/HpnK family deacetylase [Clostridia bacterium]